MFTGIVEELGTIVDTRRRGDGLTFEIKARKVLRGLGIDNSVAINGTCLTVVKKERSSFTVDAVRETLRKTALRNLKTGDNVNLERAVSLSQRLGGHLVQGHVDCTGIVAKREDLKSSWMFTIRFPVRYRKYLIPVGSIAVDGVSLTVARIVRDAFEVAIIPYTMNHTLFGSYTRGTHVNLEFDLIGKYVERLLHESARGK